MYSCYSPISELVYRSMTWRCIYVDLSYVRQVNTYHFLYSRRFDLAAGRWRTSSVSQYLLYLHPMASFGRPGRLPSMHMAVVHTCTWSCQCFHAPLYLCTLFFQPVSLMISADLGHLSVLTSRRDKSRSYVQPYKTMLHYYSRNSECVFRFKLLMLCS